MTSRQPFRLAILGCGAVTRASLLPALAGHDRVMIVALVDRDERRARELGGLYGITRIHDDVEALSRADVDGLVIATPPAHHAEATLRALGQGLHVFVEKPMAIRAADADAMVKAAADRSLALSVGMYRRLLPVTRLVRGLIDSEQFGRPLAVDVEEGGSYSWPLASLAVLTKTGGGGGVLIDLGTHLIDQLLFLVPGEPRLRDYHDNSRGGIETDCELRIELATRWGDVPARIELSRTRDLRGSVRVECERATLEIARAEFCRVLVRNALDGVVDVLTGRQRDVSVSAEWRDEPTFVGYKAFRSELDDWLDAIELSRAPLLSGRSAVPVVRLIEQSYAAARPLLEPWTDRGLATRTAPEPTGGAPALIGKTRRRVLVTGAGGFLGTRTVELLRAREEWEVRALVRRPASAARLARWPVDIVVGDVCSMADMRAAVQGCDSVVHCAVGTDWPPQAAFAVTVGGTRIAATAALEAGVRRFVHVSSMAVHGDQPPSRLDEAVPLEPGKGASYSRAKYLAEQALWTTGRQGLRAVALRPARIYGPFSRTFTVRPLSAIATGTLVLAGDAASPSNMVYVDNVVDAIVAALEGPTTIDGEAFLISEPDQLSWLAFYQYFAKAVGQDVHVAPYPKAATTAPRGFVRRWGDACKQIALSAELRGLAKKVLATDPIGTWPRRVWDGSPRLQERVLTAIGVDQAVVYREAPPRGPEKVEFRIDPTLVVFDKATRELGYAPRVSGQDAMRLTLEWARYARLL